MNIWSEFDVLRIPRLRGFDFLTGSRIMNLVRPWVYFGTLLGSLLQIASDGSADSLNCKLALQQQVLFVNCKCCDKK